MHFVYQQFTRRNIDENGDDVLQSAVLKQQDAKGTDEPAQSGLR